MANSHSEAILEILELTKSKVFFSGFNLGYVESLIFRGASVWLDDHQYEVFLRQEKNSNILDNVKSLDDSPGHFDYMISFGTKNFKRQFISESIQTKVFILDDLKSKLLWALFKGRYVQKKEFFLYSISPSLNDTKLVIPENVQVKFERYWSLYSLNPIRMAILVSGWIITKTKFLRILLTDKLVIVK